MDVKNVKSEKKVLEVKIIKLIADFENSTNTEISEISIKRNKIGGSLSVIELNTKVEIYG